MNPEKRFYEWQLGESIPEWANHQIDVAPNYIDIETKAAWVPLAKLVGTDHQRYSGFVNQKLEVAKLEAYHLTLIASNERFLLFRR